MRTPLVGNPATGESPDYLQETTFQEVLHAMELARQAFGHWKTVPLETRINFLTKLRSIIVDNLDYIVDQVCADTGKVPMDALTAEILSTVDIIKFYEQKAPKILRPQKVKTPLLLFGKSSYIDYKPMGVIAVISPWNYPFNLAVVPVVSALASGNTVILKPSEVTPQVGKVVAELFRQTSLPKGVVQVLPGGAEAGRALVQARPDKIFFTGSVATGKHIARTAAESLTPVELELGGKDAMIVFRDANLNRAVNAAVWGACTNCGQVCISVERIYVEETIYEEFLQQLLNRIQGLRRGAGPDCDIGCITSLRQLDIIQHQLDDAVRKGAEILCGGRPDTDNPMAFPPTLVVNVNYSMQIMTEETFGPVATVMKFKSPGEAVALANDSPYGLSASVWTGDRKKARDVVKQLVTGNALINDVIVSFANPHLPFGGVKNSGIGKYHGPAGLYTFCHATSVVEDAGRRDSELQWYPYSSKGYEALKGLVKSRYGSKGSFLGSIISFYKLLKYRR